MPRPVNMRNTHPRPGCPKGVDGRHGPAPVHEHAVKGQPEGHVDEDDVPHPEHAPALLHHDGVNKRRQGHEGA